MRFGMAHDGGSLAPKRIAQQARGTRATARAVPARSQPAPARAGRLYRDELVLIGAFTSTVWATGRLCGASLKVMQAHSDLEIQRAAGRFERSSADREQSDMKHYGVLWIAPSVLVLAAACAQRTVHGSGVIEDVSSNATSFTKVAVDECDARVDYDTSYSVVVKVDDNVEPYLHIEQDGGLLRIYLENDINYEHTTCTASITSPSLESLAVGDSAHAKVVGFVGATAMEFRAADSSKIALEGLDAQRMAVHVADSSAVEGDVTCDGLELDVADSSEVTLEGTARSVDLVAADSSSAGLAALKTENAEIRLADASEAEIWATGTLSGSATDSSELFYKGQPSSVSVSTSDSSSVHAF